MKEIEFPEIFLGTVAERMIIMATWTRPVSDVGLVGSMWPGVNSRELQCGE